MISSDYGLDCLEMFGPNWGKLGDLSEIWNGGSMPNSQSLVLDNEKDEIVKGPLRGGKRSEEKTVAALKSHSEAERRRRERINAHLDTLRGLVPNTEKMDKAALLAEVISQVKQMKKTAIKSKQGLIIPMDEEDVIVEPLNQKNETFSAKVSLSCEYRPELLSEVQQTLDSLHLNIVNAEMSTLGNWVRIEFVLSNKKDVISGNAEACQVDVKSVHRALRGILEKMSASAEYSPRTTLPYKRRKISSIDSTSSSS